MKAVLNARCRYLVSRATAHYHACDVPETRPHGTPMIVSRLRLLSSTKCAMAGTDASCYQGHRPGRSKHKKKPVGSPESQSKISEGVGGPRAGASGAMSEGACNEEEEDVARVRLPEPHRPPIYAWLLERRLLPSLYTSPPLGRGSSHAPV